MQQDDIPGPLGIGGMDLIDHLADDRIGARPLPVIGIDVQADDGIARLLRCQCRPQFVRRGRFGVAEIGRAEQLHAAPGIGLDQPLGGVEFEARALVRPGGKVGMAVAMVADLVAVGDDPLQQAGMLQRILADDEEGAGDMMLFQHRQDFRRPGRVRAVIEGQRQHLGLAAAGPPHLIGGGQDMIGFAQDRALRAEGDRAAAVGRRGGDAQYLARSLDIGVELARDLTQVGPAAVAEGGEIGPDARILAAQPPQRHALDAEATERLQLVPAGGCVEHPDLMAMAVIIIGEAGIAAGGIEADRGVAVMGGEPGFVERQGIGAAIMPVIAIAAERDDDAIAADAAAGILDRAGEPVLRGDRAGGAALPMLVIGHEDDMVGNLAEAGERPFLASRGGDGQLGAGGQGAAQLAQEMEIGGQRAGRQRFKVHHQSGIMMCRDRGGEPLGELAAGGRIGEQTGGAGAVPAMGIQILDHRQQLGRSAHAGDHLVEARVGMETGRGIAAGHGHQRGHDPVELADMTAQRGDAAFVIGDIEADIERAGLRDMTGPAR